MWEKKTSISHEKKYLHQVQTVINIATSVSGQNKHVRHEIDKRNTGRHIVVTIRHIENIMFWMADDCWRQMVKASKICYIALLIRQNVAIDHSFARENQMFKLFLSQRRCYFGPILKMFSDQLIRRWNISCCDATKRKLRTVWELWRNGWKGVSKRMSE